MAKAKSSSGMLVAVSVLLGICLGAGAFTFIYAEGFSYLSDEPEVCINCHVMQENYDAWLNSSHSAVATCSDCHIAQHSLAAKYWSKAVNGFNHSVAFTTGNFPEHIHLAGASLKTVEASCRGCHAAITHGIDSTRDSMEEMQCTRCHSSVGHGP